MLAFRIVVVILGVAAAALGLNLVIGGGVVAIVGGVVLLLAALGLLVLGLYTLRGSAEAVTARLTARQQELQRRAGTTPASAERAASSPETTKPFEGNRAARRAADRRS